MVTLWLMEGQGAMRWSEDSLLWKTLAKFTRLFLTTQPRDTGGVVLDFTKRALSAWSRDPNRFMAAG